MVYVSYRGVEIGEKLQNVLLGVQYLALALFVIFAFASVFGAAPPAESIAPGVDWFNPFGFESFDGFTQAILLALFIYWGWDTCLALNEETKDPKRIPGRAALISTVILMVTYVLVAVAAISYAGLDAAGRPGRRVPGREGRAVRAVGLAAGARGADLGGLVDADHDPADGARHAVDGRLQGAARPVRRRCTRGSRRPASRPWSWASSRPSTTSA